MRTLRRPLGRISAAAVFTGAVFTVAVFTAAVLAIVAAAETEPLTVTITSPPPGEAVFGEVEVMAEVFPADQAAKVEFLVDGGIVYAKATDGDTDGRTLGVVGGSFALVVGF